MTSRLGDPVSTFGSLRNGIIGPVRLSTVPIGYGQVLQGALCPN